jgi:hypothetical protein
VPSTGARGLLTPDERVLLYDHVQGSTIRWTRGRIRSIYPYTLRIRYVYATFAAMLSCTVRQAQLPRENLRNSISCCRLARRIVIVLDHIDHLAIRTTCASLPCPIALTVELYRMWLENRHRCLLSRTVEVMEQHN